MATINRVHSKYIEFTNWEMIGMKANVFEMTKPDEVTFKYFSENSIRKKSICIADDFTEQFSATAYLHDICS